MWSAAGGAAPGAAAASPVFKSRLVSCCFDEIKLMLLNIDADIKSSIEISLFLIFYKPMV